MTDLRNYLALIKKKGELKTIRKKVSTKYEIAGITAKVDGSYAVLFENVKESNFRLVTNLVGTRKRFAYAVGANESNIHEKIFSAIKGTKKPKTVSSAKFLENKSRNLSTLPIIKHFNHPFLVCLVFQNSAFHYNF